MRTLSALATVLFVSGVGSAAYAQETTTTTTTTTTDTSSDTGETGAVEMRAPKRAFEIGVSGGYTQPFGEVHGGLKIHDVASAGGVVGLALGYRFTPHWSLEGTGAYNQQVSGDLYDGKNTTIRGAAVGVQGTYHMRPYKMVDPYASLGTVYRMMWIQPDSEADDMVHGFEIAKAILGVDFRVSPSIAMGPQIGADLNLFVWDNPQGGAAGNERFANVRPSTFLFAGLGGRFDVGGDRVPHDRVAVIEEPLPTPAAGPKPEPPKAPPQPPTGLRIEQRILDICKIDGPKAYFDFDRANVKQTDQKTLDAVAECFKNGPLKGKQMNIVGRADPRGTTQYNDKLGQSRADSVSDYLTDKGVPKPEMITESRGERDATGDDELTWAYDRRVDIKLAD